MNLAPFTITCVSTSASKLLLIQQGICTDALKLICRICDVMGYNSHLQEDEIPTLLPVTSYFITVMQEIKVCPCGDLECETTGTRERVYNWFAEQEGKIIALLDGVCPNKREADGLRRIVDLVQVEEGEDWQDGLSFEQAQYLFSVEQGIKI